MITVSIIGILAAIAVPKFASLVRKANEGASKGGLGSLRSVLTIYYSDMEGLYPSSLNSITMGGKYMSTIPTLKLPPYHDNTTAINGELTLVLDTSMVVSMFCDAGFPMGAPGWGYDVYAAGTGEAMIICCGHTDTAGSVWSTY
jgi:hypothetical protein